MKTIPSDNIIEKLLESVPIIDVRAPVEFEQGALPNSTNLSILDNDERATVGTCFKKNGREKAIELGYQIVSSANKEQKIEKWKLFIQKNPNAILTCFRGGLRSQISQSFLKEVGYDIPRIDKGYKEVRQILLNNLDHFCQHNQIKLLTGNTGSGKTIFLKKVSEFYPTVDLETLAQHRGSAFGAMSDKQPSQATFENLMIVEILRRTNKKPSLPILFEDESRLIGSVHLPENIFNLIRATPVLKMNVNLEQRVENIFDDYIKPDEKIFSKFIEAIQKISTRLGGLRAQEVLSDIKKSQQLFLNQQELQSNKIWIEKLLVWYYDPMYTFSFNKRNPKIEFEGSTKQIFNYLSELAKK